MLFEALLMSASAEERPPLDIAMSFARDVPLSRRVRLADVRGGAPPLRNSDRSGSPDGSLPSLPGPMSASIDPNERRRGSPRRSCVELLETKTMSKRIRQKSSGGLPWRLLQTLRCAWLCTILHPKVTECKRCRLLAAPIIIGRRLRFNGLWRNAREHVSE